MGASEIYYGWKQVVVDDAGRLAGGGGSGAGDGEEEGIVRGPLFTPRGEMRGERGFSGRGGEGGGERVGAKWEGGTAGQVRAARRRGGGVGAVGEVIHRARRGGGGYGRDVTRRRDEPHPEVLWFGARGMSSELGGKGVGRKGAGGGGEWGGWNRWFAAPPRAEQGRGGEEVYLICARPEDCRDAQRMQAGGRRDLHPDGVRLPLSGGDHRLGQPGGSGVAAVEHQRCELLRGGAGGGAASGWKGGDF